MPPAAQRPRTVDEYLARLPEDRRTTIEAICRVIRENVDPVFEEGIQYGMIGWYVPHRVYPPGYHANPAEPLPFASIASQKHHVGLYLFCVYMNDDAKERFRADWLARGKRLDMGKSCVRVRKLEDVPLDVIGDLFRRVRVRDFLALYESSRADGSPKRSAHGRKAAAKRPRSAAKKKRSAKAKAGAKAGAKAKVKGKAKAKRKAKAGPERKAGTAAKSTRREGKAGTGVTKRARPARRR